METRARAKVEHEAAQIEKEKMELEQEREKQEKRVTMAMAEERHKLNQEFEKRTRQYDESYEERMLELEDEFAQKRDENDRKAAAFEAERGRLSTAVKERDKRIETQADELEALNERYDVLERARNSIRREKLEREAELELVKKEFALDPQPVDLTCERELGDGKAACQDFFMEEIVDSRTRNSWLVSSDPLSFRSGMEQSLQERSAATV